MRKVYLRIFSVILCSLSVFVSCAKTDSAKVLAEEFSYRYGFDTALLFSTGDEVERALDEEMLLSLYGDKRASEFIRDGAVLLGTDIDEVSEAGFFICYNSSDAMYVSELCLSRVSYLKSYGVGTDTSNCKDAKVIREGRVVFYSVLDDNERAEKIFKDMT